MLICKVPFCENTAHPKVYYCGKHRWERQKYKVKPYKEILPFGIYKRCEIHGLLRRHQVTLRKRGWHICKQCKNDYMLFKSFGITRDEYFELLEKQNHSCAICKIDIYAFRRNRPCNLHFAVDHCHDSNEIRGLLCDKCNIGIGFFKENLEAMEAAINYLKEHKGG